MISLLVTLLLTQAGPRTDGRYVPEDVAQRVAADTFDSLDVSTGVSFSAKKVKVAFGLEEDEYPWRWTKAGLEVNGAARAWAVQKDVIETDVRGSPEKLVFLPRVSEADLRKRLAARHTAAFLALTAGAWDSGKTTLGISVKGVTLDGKPATVSAQPCSHSCDGNTLCGSVTQGKRTVMIAPLDGGLAEVAIEGLCGEYRTGVELVPNGLRFTPAAAQKKP